jgi:acyl carrier protein
MGMDLLDMVFRLEKAFDIKIRTAAFTALISNRQPPDMTAGELADFVLRTLPPRRRSVSGENWINADQSCVICEYNLRGLRGDGVCPECGTPASLEGQTWAGVRQVLTDVLGIPLEQIRPNSLLAKDLGAT